MATDVKLKIGADTSEADSALRKMKGSFDSLGDGAKKNQKTFKDLGDILRFTPIAAAIGTVIKVLGSAYQEAKKLGSAGTIAQQAFVSVGDSISNFKTEYLRTAVEWTGKLILNLGFINKQDVIRNKESEEEIERLEKRNKLIRDGLEAAKKTGEAFSKELDKITLSTEIFEVNRDQIQDKINQIDFYIRRALVESGLNEIEVGKLKFEGTELKDIKQMFPTGKTLADPNNVSSLLTTRREQEKKLETVSTMSFKKDAEARITERFKIENNLEKKSIEDLILQKEANIIILELLKEEEVNNQRKIADEKELEFRKISEESIKKKYATRISEIAAEEKLIQEEKNKYRTNNNFGMSQKFIRDRFAAQRPIIEAMEKSRDTKMAYLQRDVNREFLSMVDEYKSKSSTVESISPRRAELSAETQRISAELKEREKATEKLLDESVKDFLDDQNKQIEAEKELKELALNKLTLQEKYNSLILSANKITGKQPEDELKKQKLLDEATETNKELLEITKQRSDLEYNLSLLNAGENKKEIAKIEKKRYEDITKEYEDSLKLSNDLNKTEMERLRALESSVKLKKELKDLDKQSLDRTKDELKNAGYEIGDDGKLRRIGKKPIVSAEDAARTIATQRKNAEQAMRAGMTPKDNKDKSIAEKQADMIREIRDALVVQEKK